MTKRTYADRKRERGIRTALQVFRLWILALRDGASMPYVCAIGTPPVDRGTIGEASAVMLWEPREPRTGVARVADSVDKNDGGYSTCPLNPASSGRGTMNGHGTRAEGAPWHVQSKITIRTNLGG